MIMISYIYYIDTDTNCNESMTEKTIFMGGGSNMFEQPREQSNQAF